MEKMFWQVITIGALGAVWTALLSDWRPPQRLTDIMPYLALMLAARANWLNGSGTP